MYLILNNLTKQLFYYNTITAALFFKQFSSPVSRMGNVLSPHLNIRIIKRVVTSGGGGVGYGTGAIFPTLHYPGLRHRIPTVAFLWKFYLKILLTVDKCSGKYLDIPRTVDVMNGGHYKTWNFQIDIGHVLL
jgi:hypothetical protein